MHSGLKEEIVEITATFLMAGDRRLKHCVDWKYPEGTAKSVEENVRKSHKCHQKATFPMSEIIRLL